MWFSHYEKLPLRDSLPSFPTDVILTQIKTQKTMDVKLNIWMSVFMKNELRTENFKVYNPF